MFAQDLVQSLSLSNPKWKKKFDKELKYILTCIKSAVKKGHIRTEVCPHLPKIFWDKVILALEHDGYKVILFEWHILINWAHLINKTNEVIPSLSIGSCKNCGGPIYETNKNSCLFCKTTSI